MFDGPTLFRELENNLRSFVRDKDRYVKRNGQRHFGNKGMHILAIGYSRIVYDQVEGLTLRKRTGNRTKKKRTSSREMDREKMANALGTQIKLQFVDIDQIIMQIEAGDFTTNLLRVTCEQLKSYIDRINKGLKSQHLHEAQKRLGCQLR